MGQQYSVTFVNNSTNHWDFCVFQQDPNITSSSDPMALAWFVKQIDPNTSGVFSWEIDYSFVWFEAGTTADGKVKYTTGGQVSADLSQSNEITLSYDGAFEFGTTSQNTTSGTIFINEDATVPLQKGFVGIGMSGSGTFAVAAEPNIGAAFTPKPTYWCTFGQYEVGQVMNISETTQPKEIVFEGVFDITLTLSADNIWSQSARLAKAVEAAK